MAAITAVLAMAGILIPVLEPLVMTVWTLPVVVICLRRGMKAGAVTMAVAGMVIMITATPAYAADMLIRSTGPALIIGYGFHHQWKSETTILCTAVAAFVGLVASFALSIFVMGVGAEELFSIQPETISEIVGMFSDYGLLDRFQMTVADMTEMVSAMAAMLKYLFPSILLIAGLFTAFSNYAAANFVLGKLKVTLPPVTKLSTFRLPFGLVFGFIIGMGLTVIGGAFWPGTPLIARIGQNTMIVFVAIYFFQGFGLILSLIEKTQQNMRKFWKIALLIVFLITFLYFFTIVGYLGIADALFDFRRLRFSPEKK